ncbi:MAG: paraquat-inducible protein A [Candidatus Acidiferrales bacterium]
MYASGIPIQNADEPLRCSWRMAISPSKKSRSPSHKQSDGKAHASRRSMFQSFPWHYEVPVLIVSCAVLLWIGLSRPLFELEKGFLWKHWRTSYSVLRGIISLTDEKQYFLAGVVFVFSMIFPILKLTALGCLWLVPLRETERTKALHWLSVLGKWSMMDVFAVAVLVVAVKLGPLAKVRAESGVYFFCLAILLSMIATIYVERLAQDSG